MPLVLRVHRVLPGLPVLRVPQGRQVLQGLRVLRALQERRVLQGPRALQGPLEQRGRQGLRVHQERRVHPELRVRRVLKAQRALRVLVLLLVPIPNPGEQSNRAIRKILMAFSRRQFRLEHAAYTGPNVIHKDSISMSFPTFKKKYIPIFALFCWGLPWSLCKPRRRPPQSCCA